MPPIRILIVDDSAVVRRQLSQALSADPGIVVAGTAGNGVLALAQIVELHPDLVTLDVDMPVMDGLATLVQLRKLYPRLPVIMFSNLTGPGAAATVEALARGASDYASKPSQASSLENALEQVGRELIPKIKALCAGGFRHEQPAPEPPIVSLASHPSRIDVVAIGASTGGPNALAQLITELPRDFPVPIVIVQHMPPMFTKLLAGRLDALSQLDVMEAKNGQQLKKGQVWIAPGDYHLTVGHRGNDYWLGLNQDAPENSCRPAVDVLFRSVARAFGSNVLGVVLTGMGCDGTSGAAAIREVGGSVIAQDEITSVVWGMPGSIVTAGLADRICPLSGIVPEIVRRAWFRRSAGFAARI